MECNCPYCKAPNQEMEDLGDHPDYLTAFCDTCGKGFSINTNTYVLYDDKGKIIHEGDKSNEKH